MPLPARLPQAHRQILALKFSMAAQVSWQEPRCVRHPIWLLLLLWSAAFPDPLQVLLRLLSVLRRVAVDK